MAGNKDASAPKQSSGSNGKPSGGIGGILMIAAVILVAGFLLMSGIMFALNFCPPAGPWPMPPWCSKASSPAMPAIPSAEQIQNAVPKGIPAISAGAIPSGANGANPAPNGMPGFFDKYGCIPKDCSLVPSGQPRDFCTQVQAGTFSWQGECAMYPSDACRKLCLDSKPAADAAAQKKALDAAAFNPREVSYLQSPDAKGKKLIFSLGMMDIWGMVCKPNTFLEKCEDNTALVVPSFTRARQIGTDLIMFTDFAVMKKDLSMVMQNNPSGAHEASQADLSSMASHAHSKNMRLMIMTNLYDAEDGARSSIDYANPSDDMLSKLFDGWQAIMEHQASKAQEAGADYLIINPRDIQFNSFDAKSDLVNLRFSKIMASVRSKYSGKVCVWGHNDFIANPKLGFINSSDCVILDDDMRSPLHDAGMDTASMQFGWERYLTSSAFKAHSGKEIFVLLLMPSYGGVMKNGWVEPVAVYPEGKYAQDQKVQALAYDALFRAIANSSARVDGVISYGYWWSDNTYPEYWMRSDISHSIRGKDAEQAYYSWAKSFAHENKPA